MATTTQGSNFDRLKQSGKKWRATGKREPQAERANIVDRAADRSGPMATSARCWLAETAGRTSFRQWPK